MALASIDRFYRMVGYESLTVAGTSVGLSQGTGRTSGWQGNIGCTFVVYSAPVRMRLDGNAATATTGFHLEPGESITLDGPTDLKDVRFIREGAVSSVLEVHYFSVGG